MYIKQPFLLYDKVQSAWISHFSPQIPFGISHSLLKRQSLTTVLLKTSITQMIFFNQSLFVMHRVYYSYISALSWLRENGAIDEFPDPLRTNFSTEQVRRASTDRKTPALYAPIADPKQRKFTKIADKEEQVAAALDVFDKNGQFKWRSQRIVSQPCFWKKVVDQETQTVLTKYRLSAKVKTMILMKSKAWKTTIVNM